MDEDTLPHDDIRIVPSDTLEVQVTVSIDMGHQKSDFVAVSGNHYFRETARIENGVRIAEDIGMNFIGKRLRSAPKDSLRGLFETGGAGSVDKVLQDL